MKKDEYIAKYGKAAWEQYKVHHNRLNKNWRQDHKEQDKQLNKKWYEQQHKERCINGRTRYCRENYDLIENYELAKADNFDPKKWHLHHRLENYWSSATLKRKGLYDNVNPEALI